MTGSTGSLGGELTEASGGRAKAQMKRREGDGGRVTGKKIHSNKDRLLSIRSSCAPAYKQGVLVLEDLCAMLCG